MRIRNASLHAFLCRLALASTLTSSTASTTSTSPSTPPLHSLPKSSILLTSNLICTHFSQSVDILSSPSTPIAQQQQQQQPIHIDRTSLDPFPWSFTPLCYESRSLNLCVYTSAGFSDGRGISIFTTPEIAKEFEVILGRGPLDKVNHRGGHVDPTYLSALPGKGTGTLASRPLARGELITAYTPLLLSYREDTLSTGEREIFLRQAVDQLPRKSRELYYSLAKIYHVDSVIAQDVLKANTFGVEVGGWEHLGVWPETARINHACGPNSQYLIVGSSLTHYVHAARSIEKDEEVTVTYTHPFNPTNKRQTDLSSAFHFTCTCPRCTYSSDSDTLLRRITHLQSLLSDWESPTSSHTATVKDAERLIAIYEEEGLDGFLDIPYGHAALMYSAAGDREGVLRFAALAREAVGLKEGVGVGDWGFWDRMVAQPEAHWSWGRRIVKENEKGETKRGVKGEAKEKAKGKGNGKGKGLKDEKKKKAKANPKPKNGGKEKKT